MSEYEYHNAGNSEAGEKIALSRLFAQSGVLAAPGVLGGLAVTQNATADGNVLIASGSCVLHPSMTVGASLLVNDTTKTLNIFTANPVGALPRNDIVVFDSVTATITAIIGTPNASPTDPTVPNTALALARLRHAASATTIPTAKIDQLQVATTLRGVNPAAPFAQAAGLVSGFSAGTLNPGAGITSLVTFPAGRFTVAPLVQATLQNGPGGSGSLTARAMNATTAQVSVYVYNAGSSAVAFSGLNLAWSATQMTATTAAG